MSEAWLTGIATVLALFGVFRIFLYEKTSPNRPRRLPDQIEIIDYGPSIIKESFQMRNGHNGVNYRYKGNRRHAAPSAYHLNRTGEKLIQREHHERLASMQYYHGDRLNVLEKRHQNGLAADATRLAKDLRKHKTAYQDKKRKHRQDMADLKSQTIETNDQCQKILIINLMTLGHHRLHRSMNAGSKLEEELRGRIGALKDFQGYQEEFDEVYEDGRRVLAEMMRSNPVLPPSIATIERNFHQTALETRKRMRERIKQMDRAALLQHNQTKLMQRKAAKSGGGDDEVDSMANDITASLHRMTRTMQEENDKAILSHQILERSTRKLQGTNEKYDEFGKVLGTTSGAIKGLQKRERSDKFWIGMALLGFLLASLHIVFARIWVPPMWLVGVPLKWVVEKWRELTVSVPVKNNDVVVDDEQPRLGKDIDLSVQSEKTVESPQIIESPELMENAIFEDQIPETVTLADSSHEVDDINQPATSLEKTVSTETVQSSNTLAEDKIATEAQQPHQTSYITNQTSDITIQEEVMPTADTEVSAQDEQTMVTEVVIATMTTETAELSLDVTEKIEEVVVKPSQTDEILSKVEEDRETVFIEESTPTTAITTEESAIVKSSTILLQTESEPQKTIADTVETVLEALEDEPRPVQSEEEQREEDTPTKPAEEEPETKNNIDLPLEEPLADGEPETESFIEDDEAMGYSSFDMFNSSDFNSEDIAIGDAFNLGSTTQESEEQIQETPITAEEAVIEEAEKEEL